jgi:hypothetical protein
MAHFFILSKFTMILKKMFLQRGYLAWEKIHRRTNLTVQKPVFALSVKCRIPFRVLLTDKIYHFSFPLQPLIDGGKTQKFPKFGGNLSQKNKKAVTDVRRAPILHRIRAVLHTVVLSLTVSKTHPSYTNPSEDVLAKTTKNSDQRLSW